MFDKDIIKKHIEVNPNVQHGKPCIKGTRTPVYVILESLATGMSFSDVQKEFHPVTLEDIRACIAYAHAVIANDSLETVEMAGK